MSLRLSQNFAPKWHVCCRKETPLSSSYFNKASGVFSLEISRHSTAKIRSSQAFKKAVLEKRFKKKVPDSRKEPALKIGNIRAPPVNSAERKQPKAFWRESELFESFRQLPFNRNGRAYFVQTRSRKYSKYFGNLRRFPSSLCLELKQAEATKVAFAGEF
ncbi:hypothetical protein BaRGS_00004250 [Batillaria attramentaria]|uniref:Uncharacterized protein n=1 Tax=Batillaria attramentaria TaxID=370345 RepID=A0ABD0LZD8_9CAEN